MAAERRNQPCIFLWFGLPILMIIMVYTADAGLKMSFYRKSCPKAEKMVAEFVRQHIVPSLAPALLRLHFHDCFVRGCDASVVLNYTAATGNKTEKAAVPNQTLRGFAFIDKVKNMVEALCPETVSCADIVALVTRDAVVAIGGPAWKVPTGRRDGAVSNSSEALAQLPQPLFNITQLKVLFASKGLSTKDLVVLSGAHTIGRSHCDSFSNRIYNFTDRGDADPTLDPSYVVHLKRKCRPGDRTSLAEMDAGSFETFDESYYTLVAERRGLFTSDSVLLDDTETRAYVLRRASKKDQSEFFRDFEDSMVKMGKIGVLTGRHGEIRKQCASVN